MKLQINLQKRPARSLEELQSDSKTLLYELESLLNVAKDYAQFSDRMSRTQRNVYIEAFALHCRALICFLYGHLDGITVNGATQKLATRDTDVLAYDFHQGWHSDCPPPCKVMAMAKRQADKHVAHITAERREINQRGSASTSDWKLGEVTSAICEVVGRFLETAPKDKFDPVAFSNMNALLGEWTTLTSPNQEQPVCLSREPAREGALSGVQAKTEGRFTNPLGSLQAKTCP